MNSRRFVLLLVVIVALALVASGVYAYRWLSAPAGVALEISDVWARPSAGLEAGGSSAIYLTLRNIGRTPDRLVGASSDVAEVVQLHNTETRNGVSMMFMLEAIEVPARSQVLFQPGGLHIMLIQLKRPLLAGETITATLEFEKSGPLKLDVEVRNP